MNRMRMSQVEDLYHAAIECDEEQREAFLEKACCGDTELLSEVKSLLSYAGQAREFLESSPSFPASPGGPVRQPDCPLLGTRIGSYKILSRLGSGGIGEVYLAEDFSLDRKVALKILRPELSEDPTARKRFLREAKAAAALDHPFVCNIFEVGEADGRAFIAMEHVVGQTLQDRLRHELFPLRKALQIIAEIAEALAAAHLQGIVHRDLKPSNIMLTDSGHMKVLDFGLARRVTSSRGAGRVDSTLTPATPGGWAAGTPAYMSPEQLRGERPGMLSDIFSLGIVCYEVLTGVHPFHRPKLAETISAILNEDPPTLARYRDSIPEVLQYIVRKMLAKDPAGRFQSAHEIRTDILAIERESAWMQNVPGSAASSLPRRSTWTALLPWLLLPLVVAITWVLSRAPDPGRPASAAPDLRFTIALPEGQRLTSFFRQGVAVSPDGRLLAFVAGTTVDAALVPQTNLYIRPLNEPRIRIVAGTENGLNPVFSPDGAELAFLDSSSRALKKVSVEGGVPLTVCECSAEFGFDWGNNRTIIYGSRNGLQRVSASGGDPEMVTQLDEAAGEVGHFLPRLLPGGKAVLFTAVRYKNSGTKDWSRARLFVHSLETGRRKLLIEGGSDARYVPTGHLVFAREGRLMGVPFDLQQLATSGTPTQILEGINHSIHSGTSDGETGVAQFSFSDTGLLAYVAGSVFPEQRSALIWIDRQGEQEALEVEPKSYFSVRLSADDRQVLLTTLYPPRDVWLYYPERKILQRQTFEGNHTWAIWGPEPGEFTSDSDVEGPDAIYTKRVDSGPGRGTKLMTGLEVYQKPSSWSPDGATLAVAVLDPETGPDIWMLSGGRMEPFLKSRFAESSPEFSPDGRWLAYVSDETRRSEVHVRPYPGPGSPVQVSHAGGAEPGWSRDGKEIFFRSGRTFFAARVHAGTDELQVETPAVLFEANLGRISNPVRSWDLGADGRFLLSQGLDEETRRALVQEVNPAEIHLVQNWFDELRHLVPPEK